MTFTETTNGYVVRIEAGEELITMLTAFADEHEIHGAFFIGLGALKYARIGMYFMHDYEYHFQDFDEPHEITNVTGNIARHNNELAVHAHITIADQHQRAYGGHIDEAVIEPTCEIRIVNQGVSLTRTVDEHSQLPLLDLGWHFHRNGD